jgi:hypothetical protein
MNGPEGFNAKPIPEEEAEDVVSPEDAAVMNRRSFLKRGAAAVAGVALGTMGLSEDAEARNRRERGERSERRERRERRENRRQRVEYVGFRPNAHQKMLIQTRLQNIVPGALSTEITLNKTETATIYLRVSVLTKEGTQIQATGNEIIENKAENYLTPALTDVLNALEETVNKKKAFQPKQPAPEEVQTPQGPDMKSI